MTAAPLPADRAQGLTLAQFLAGEGLAATVAASRQGQYPFGITLGTLEAAGIAVEDLRAARHGSGFPEVEDDRSMYLTLLNYDKACPGLTLRSAVGWYLALRADPSVPVTDPIYTWTETDPGLAETGWLFLAAGIGVDEARVLLRSGTAPDADTLVAMAALRGAVLPVTD